MAAAPPAEQPHESQDELQEIPVTLRHECRGYDRFAGGPVNGAVHHSRLVQNNEGVLLGFGIRPPWGRRWRCRRISRAGGSAACGDQCDADRRAFTAPARALRWCCSTAGESWTSGPPFRRSPNAIELDRRPDAGAPQRSTPDRRTERYFRNSARSCGGPCWRSRSTSLPRPRSMTRHACDTLVGKTIDLVEASSLGVRSFRRRGLDLNIAIGERKERRPVRARGVAPLVLTKGKLAVDDR